MSTILWPYSFQKIERDGYTADAVAFYVAGTDTPLAVYSESTASTAIGTTLGDDEISAQGYMPAVFIAAASYRMRATSTTNGVTTVVWDQDNIPGYIAPVEPSESSVTDDEIFNTGDILIRAGSGVKTGWVRVNGRTIGAATSGAAERANADVEDLFTHLWDTFSDTICPVSTGRGANAAADWAANKTITLPDWRGRTLFGADDMGNSAGGIAQVSTTISTTSGSPTATAASATGLSVGMYVVSANVPAGTTISALAGTTITLSGNASATASGTAARFSFFTDAQTIGAQGGAQTHTILYDHLPSSGDLTGTAAEAGAHTHTYEEASYSGRQGGASTSATQNTEANTGEAGAHTHDVTVTLGGSDEPFGAMPPGAIVTFYMKL